MSIKKFARNSRAEHGCANLGFWASFCRKKNSIPIKNLVWGGGWVLGGGRGSANSIFMGAGIFLKGDKCECSFWRWCWAELGSSQTWLFQTWLLAAFTWMRSFALFCVLASALFCAHLRSFARICVFEILRPTAFRATAFWELQMSAPTLRIAISLRFLTAGSGIAMNSAVGISFVCLNRRENPPFACDF